MRIRVSKETLTQAAFTTFFLTLLCAFYLARPQRAGEPLEGLGQPSLEPAGAEDGDADASQGELEELRTLPAYRAAQRAVVQLNAARAALLKAAAAVDAAATRSAAEDYQRTLEQVRSAATTLKGYVEPAEFQRCLRELFRVQTEVELGDAAIQESLLGILPRVSVLPQENRP
ncbi:MAG: hypothetical protein MUE50_16360 [Pirellulaceae bacterium]|nr:hypothetical protein [Pirellulaceae bacterium]